MGLFPDADPKREAQSKVMNSMILAAARRGRISTGGTARLSGDTSTPLAVAFSNLKAAERSGDADAVAFAEHVLDSRLSDARAARQSDGQLRDPDTGQFVEQPGFDGGFIGRGTVAPPAGLRPAETATDLLRRSLEAHASEIRERNAGLSPAARQIVNA